MSRIGKKAIEVPAGVKVAIDPAAHRISVEGPKGKLAQDLRPEIRVRWAESEKRIECSIDPADSDDKQVRAYWGLTRALIANMIKGAAEGYQRKLEIVGVGWGCKLQGMNLVLNLGYADPITMPVPAAVKCEVQGNSITISGPDLQAVGQFAAAIRSKRKPEPYKGKGVKYSDEVIARKQGKTAGG
jgi:large subunit ribosomal protein L6